MKKIIFFLFRILIGIGIIFAIFKLVPYHQLVSIFQNSKKIYIYLGILTNFATFFICVLRWRDILKNLGIKIPLRQAFASYFSSNFFNLFFPSSIAGDVFRSVTITSHYGDGKKIASSVFLDRFSGMVGLCIFSIIAFIFGSRLIGGREVLLSITALTLAIIFLSFLVFHSAPVKLFSRLFSPNSKFAAKLNSLHNELCFFKNNPLLFARNILFSLLVQLISCYAFFISSKAFSLNVSFIYFMILVPLIMVVAMIPITVAGVGTREAAAVYFFSLIGVAKTIGLSLSLLNLVYGILAGVLGGIFYVSLHNRCFQRNS